MGERINKAEFDKITKKYRDKNPGKTRAVIMERASFERLLNTKATHFAIYFAENDAGNDTVAIVGMSDNKLMYDTAENRGGVCPPACPD
ncbi:MAG: hypothetical protein ACOYW3_07010 [Bacteroidota bacterium]